MFAVIIAHVNKAEFANVIPWLTIASFMYLLGGGGNVKIANYYTQRIFEIWHVLICTGQLMCFHFYFALVKIDLCEESSIDKLATLHVFCAELKLRKRVWHFINWFRAVSASIFQLFVNYTNSKFHNIFNQ